jgi:hypothetical protein
MLDIIDATDAPDFLPPDFTAAPPESQIELGDQIADLWSRHLNAKNTAKATNEELRNIRARLGEQLHEMKQVLAQPGRGGQWSGFLREHGIPRATADRLVERYQRPLNPDLNCVTEEVSEPTDEEVQKLFTSVWPNLQRTLRTPQSLYRFIDLLTFTYDGACRCVTDKGIFVLKPAEPTICPASSDGEPVVETELDSALPLVPDQEIANRTPGRVTLTM